MLRAKRTIPTDRKTPTHRTALPPFSLYLRAFSQKQMAHDLGREARDGTWWTCFPPPADFDGEQEGELGHPFYRRTLTAEEEAAMLAREAAPDEAEIARWCALRDRFFGLPPRGGPGFSAPREAETSETSEEEEDRGEGPLEYKSMHPPTPSFRRKPEPMNTKVRGPHRRCPWIPDQVRDDVSGHPHIQTAPSRHPC